MRRPACGEPTPRTRPCARAGCARGWCDTARQRPLASEPRCADCRAKLGGRAAPARERRQRRLEGHPAPAPCAAVARSDADESCRAVLLRACRRGLPRHRSGKIPPALPPPEEVRPPLPPQLVWASHCQCCCPPSPLPPRLVPSPHAAAPGMRATMPREEGRAQERVAGCRWPGGGGVGGMLRGAVRAWSPGARLRRRSFAVRVRGCERAALREE